MMSVVVLIIVALVAFILGVYFSKWIFTESKEVEDALRKYVDQLEDQVIGLEKKVSRMATTSKKKTATSANTK